MDSLGLLGITEPVTHPPSPVTPVTPVTQPSSEMPVTHLEVAISFGSEIVLHYSLNPSEPGSLKLFDATGRMVKSITVQGQGEVKVAAFSPGVYFGRLEVGGESVTRKVVFEGGNRRGDFRLLRMLAGIRERFLAVHSLKTWPANPSVRSSGAATSLQKGGADVFH